MLFSDTRHKNVGTYLKSSERMQFIDIRKNDVGLIFLPQFTTKVNRFYRDQIVTIVGQKSSIFARSFWVRCYRQDPAINISVWHSFSGFQKGLALLPSSNGSEVINFAVKITRILEKPARLRSRKKQLGRIDKRY